MDTVLILLSSMTSANRLAYMMMRQYGVKVYVIQTPRSIAINGCSYCVRVERRYLNQAWELVQKLGASTKGAFSEADYSRVI